MLKKLCLILLIVNPVVFLFLLNTKVEPPQSTIVDHYDAPITPLPQNKIPELATYVNAQNESVKSFICNDVSVKVWENGRAIRLSGFMAYEKPKNFRFTMRSILGSEIDLGANATIYWYWSKRDRDPGLYWATYEDFHKTRLKTPFNPLLLRSSLGFEKMNLETATFVETEPSLLVSCPQKDAMGKVIVYTTVINKATRQVDGYVITDQAGKKLAVCEIRQRKGPIPTQLLYRWYEEDHTMLIDFSNPLLNQPIHGGNWQRPNRQPQINMGEE